MIDETLFANYIYLLHNLSISLDVLPQKYLAAYSSKSSTVSEDSWASEGSYYLL